MIARSTKSQTAKSDGQRIGSGPAAVGRRIYNRKTTVDVGFDGHSQQAAPLLVTPAQAAELLAISERALWTLGSTGELPKIRIGRSVRYAVRDIETFIVRQQGRD